MVIRLVRTGRSRPIFNLPGRNNVPPLTHELLTHVNTGKKYPVGITKTKARRRVERLGAQQ